jgi:hypothetical protein
VTSRGPRAGGALRWIVLLVIVAAALVQLPMPFWGDQALFAYAAHGMRHGDRLYVDFWDYKQPGIYLWYLVSGSLFGFHEAGIHIGELIWAVAFAAATQRMLRDRVQHRWVADVAPLFTVGAFLATARAWDLTQIEDLVAFPLLLTIWSAAAADAAPPHSRARALRLLLSGLAAAVVVYFKLVYVLIPLIFWLALLVRWRRREHERATTSESALLLGGLVVPLLPLLAYFLAEHLLGTMWWTYVTYPPRIVSSIDPPPFSRLRDGVEYFVKSFVWLVPLAVIGLRAQLARARRPRDPLVVGLVIWFVVGWGTVLIQNQWGYQFVLPLTPLGLLAVFGLDHAVGAWNAQRTRRVLALVGVVVVALAGYPAVQAVHKVKALAQDDLTLSANGRHAYDADFEPYYRDAREAVAWVNAPGRTPGAIHVEGNPLIQYLSNRPYALREHGWAPEQSDARLWGWTRAELRAAQPVYLWVDDFSLDIMRKRSHETLTLISQLYCKVHPVADGAWYALRTSDECRETRP